jgi:hypothetical protein
MGHLVNPVSFRLGISRYWNSRWVAYSSRHKYHFLFKSDWNIFEVVKRFFKLNRFIKESYIFSHCMVVRTNNVSNFFIFFWDGKTLQNIGNFFFEIVKFLFKYRLLRKIAMVISFFFYKQNFDFFLFSFFKNFFFLLKVQKNLLFFFKQKLFFFLLYRFYLYPFFFLFNSKKYFLKKFYFFFYFFLINFFYLFNKTYFLSMLQTINVFFRVFFFQNFFFVKFFSFFRFFLNDIYMLRILVYQNPFSQSIFFRSTGRSRVFSILNFFLRKFISGLGLNYNFNLFLLPITKLDYTSIFIGRYLAIRLKQRYRLMQALGPIFKELKRNRMLDGFRIMCSGRFTKKEIATYQWHRHGSVPLSTLKAHVDFANVPFVMKYSVCSFRVWLHRKVSRISEDFLNHYFFRELSKFSYKKALKLIFFSTNTFLKLNYNNFFFNFKSKNMNFNSSKNSIFEKFFEFSLKSLYNNDASFSNNFGLSSKMFLKTFSSQDKNLRNYFNFLKKFLYIKIFFSPDIFFKNFFFEKKGLRKKNFGILDANFLRFFLVIRKLFGFNIKYFDRFSVSLFGKKNKNLSSFLGNSNLSSITDFNLLSSYKKNYNLIFVQLNNLFFINFFFSFLKRRKLKIKLKITKMKLLKRKWKPFKVVLKKKKKRKNFYVPKKAL